MDAFTILLYFNIVQAIALGIFALWMNIFRDKDKTFFLFFDTDKSCTIEAEKVRDGFVKFKKKYFFVDKAKPMILQRFMGFQNPLLFLKWNDVIPVDVVRKTVRFFLPFKPFNKDEVLTDPELIKRKKDHEKSIKKNPDELTDDEMKTFKEIEDERNITDPRSESYLLRKKVTPETLKDIVDSRIASNLLKPIGTIDMLLWIGIGLAVGVLLTISLKATGILPL